jgi:hypothetical protein
LQYILHVSLQFINPEVQPQVAACPLLPGEVTADTVVEADNRAGQENHDSYSFFHFVEFYMINTLNLVLLSCFPEKSSCEIGFISCVMVFISHEMGFVSCEIFFISCEIFSISQETGFISREIFSISCEIFFISPETDSIS